MIDCPVCGTRNHHLATVCSSCGGFVQGRVENLDLFSTIWKLIEQPRYAFHQICIARFKNYSTIISAIAGVGFVFAFFWYVKAGDQSGSAFNLLAGGAVAGPPVGVLLTFLLTLTSWTVLRATGVRVRFRNLYAVLAYSLIPVLLAVVFVLPLEIFTFGRYFFSTNPPPWLLKPVSYYLFISLGAAVACWTFLLSAIGMRALLDTGWAGSVAVTSAISGLVILAGWIGGLLLAVPAT